MKKSGPRGNLKLYQTARGAENGRYAGKYIAFIFNLLQRQLITYITASGCITYLEVEYMTASNSRNDGGGEGKVPLPP